MPNEMWKKISRIEMASNILKELEQLLCKYENHQGHKPQENHQD